MAKKSHFTSLSLVSGMFALVVLLYYLWFAEASPVTYKNIPFPPQIEHVHPGEIVPLMVERCNSSNHEITYRTTHTLVNVVTGARIMLPDVAVSLPPGCTSAISLINRIPPEIPGGIYHVTGIATVNGTLKEFHLLWYSQPFAVEPADKK